MLRFAAATDAAVARGCCPLEGMHSSRKKCDSSIPNADIHAIIDKRLVYLYLTVVLLVTATREVTRDLQNDADVCEMVDAFYRKVRADAVLGVIFDRAAAVDWDQHLPLMHRFWQTVLLHKPGYRGNPIDVHVRLNEELSRTHGIELKPGDFERWLTLFCEAIDERFRGRRAEMAKRGARRMGEHIMQALSTSTTCGRAAGP